MLSAVEFCHLLLQAHLRPGDWAIDATAGKGHDTLFLARQVGPEGRVFAFDLQPEATETTRTLLESHGISPECCQPLTCCHSLLSDHLPPEAPGRIAAALFNLGYLPGGDKKVITRPDTTLAAAKTSLGLLRPGGLLLLVLYPGHEGGAEETAFLRDFAASLVPGDFHASEFKALNARVPAPMVLIIRKSPGKPGGLRR